ncbi:MAG: hypothetical protein ABIQ49_11235 [Gemmatimonadales bacterium]
MQTRLAVTLLIGAVAGCAGGTTSSPIPPAPGPPTATSVPAAVPASLLRRVAEAADGLRDGNEWYVVADRAFPHAILGVFPTSAAAVDSVARAAGTEWEVFGPFKTTENPPYEAAHADDVIEVIVVTSQGQKHYDGTRIDAIFWGLTAFDKFVAPYLTAVGGVRYAAEQRELYRQGKSPLANSKAIPHYRTSF